MSWSSRRKSLWGYGTLIVLLLAIGIPLFSIFYVAPTCFDGKQNQNEQGVDCGGKCARVCASAFLSPRVRWSRADKLSDGVYNLAAYITNPNLDGKVDSAPYIFKVYDKNGRQVAERRGTTYIPARKNTLAFESAIRTDNTVPGLVTFEFTAPLEWEKTSFQNDGVIVASKDLVEDTHQSVLTAVLRNTTLNTYNDFFVYAVLYDAEQNQVGFSRTKVDRLPRNETVQVQFTWPVQKDVHTSEVLPSINF